MHHLTPTITFPIDKFFLPNGYEILPSIFTPSFPQQQQRNNHLTSPPVSLIGATMLA